MKSGFYIGANGGFLYPEYTWMYKELGFTTNVDWGYLGEWQPWNDWMGKETRIYGGFFDTLEGRLAYYPPDLKLPVGFKSWLPDGYFAGVSNIMNNWYNTTGIKNTAFYRSSKIEKPCFGQRSTYQVEDNIIQIEKHPGYGYVVSETGRDEDDVSENETARVKRCVPGRDPINRYIARNLYENNEQTNVITQRDYGNAYYSDRKRPGDDFRWYIKPRMRIDKDFANNPANSEKKVIRIEIYNYDGNPAVPPVDVRVKDFLDANNRYKGGYKEMYRFDDSNPYKLSVPGNLLATDNTDTNAYYTPSKKSRVDYRIYWYGEAEVWLDYVRLDDEWAHYLFTDPDGKLPGNRYRFGERIKAEVKALSDLPGFGYFYFDEFYYNNIPCVAEVLRLIKSVNPNTGILMLGPPAVGVAAGIKNELSWQEIYNYMESQGLLADFALTQTYPFFDYLPLPPNLSKPDVNLFPGTVKYTSASDNEEYNDAINNEAITHRSIFRTIAGKLRSNTGLVFISTIQTHSVETNFIYAPSCDKVPDYERKREPTNEEISLQAYYSMTYGAKQIHYFMMFSDMRSRECGNTTRNYYDWGLTYYDTQGLQRRRDTNYYGQKKWNFIKFLDSSLMKIGTYMYESNSLSYDNTISVAAGERYKFITDLKSYYRNDSPPYDYQFAKSDSPGETYWEIGFFSNPAAPSSKYFLVLNKRCVPEKSQGQGDFRKVRLYLNTAELQESDNWALVNPITGSRIEFNKNSIRDGVLIPEEFKPAEAKLFLLTPL